MKTDTLISRLLELPAAIAKAEDALLNAHLGRLRRAEMLKDREAKFLIIPKGEEGFIEGSNAEQRAAHLRSLTAPERDALLECESHEGDAKLALSALQTEFSALKTVARLISKDGE